MLQSFSPFFTMMMMRRSHFASVLLCLLGCSSLGMAVDRSKFRTCSQTSFCRRHRENHSSRLYQYRLDPQSVHFHVLEKGTSSEATAADKASLWKSLSKRILGHGGGGDNEDPYVQGPPPTLTGLLHNTAPETSSGKEETLHWSVHAMADGLVRMRITETAMPARVTYDELILTADSMARPNMHSGFVRKNTRTFYLKWLQKIKCPITWHCNMEMQMMNMECCS